MPQDNITLVNGQAYDYTKIRINLLSQPLYGVSSINYTEEQEKVNNFGAGNRPVSQGEGPINASGSIELHMNDVELIRNAAPERSLLKLPKFDLTVAFVVAGKTKVHVLKNCGFTTDGVEASEGDTAIKRSFDLILSHVQYS